VNSPCIPQQSLLQCESSQNAFQTSSFYGEAQGWLRPSACQTMEHIAF